MEWQVQHVKLQIYFDLPFFFFFLQMKSLCLSFLCQSMDFNMHESGLPLNSCWDVSRSSKFETIGKMTDGKLQSTITSEGNFSKFIC